MLYETYTVTRTGLDANGAMLARVGAVSEMFFIETSIPSKRVGPVTSTLLGRIKFGPPFAEGP